MIIWIDSSVNHDVYFQKPKYLDTLRWLIRSAQDEISEAQVASSLDFLNWLIHPAWAAFQKHELLHILILCVDTSIQNQLHLHKSQVPSYIEDIHWRIRLASAAFSEAQVYPSLDTLLWLIHLASAQFLETWVASYIGALWWLIRSAWAAFHKHNFIHLSIFFIDSSVYH